jgi:hypothetical protein
LQTAPLLDKRVDKAMEETTVMKKKNVVVAIFIMVGAKSN